VKLHVEPTVILIPTRIDDEIHELLDVDRTRRDNDLDAPSISDHDPLS
jgi:hypothetical protein